MFEQLCLVDRPLRTVLGVKVTGGRRLDWLAPGAADHLQEFALRLWLVDRGGRPFRRTVRVRRTAGGPLPGVLGWRWAAAPGGAVVVVALGRGGGGGAPRLVVSGDGRSLHLGSVALPELVGEPAAEVAAVAAAVAPGLVSVRGQVVVEGYARSDQGHLYRLHQSREFAAEVAAPGVQAGDEAQVEARVVAVHRRGLLEQVAATVRVGGWALRPVLVPGDGGGLWLRRQVVAPVATEVVVAVDLAPVPPAVTWVEGEADLPEVAARLLFARARVDRGRRVLVEVVALGTGYHCLHLPLAGVAEEVRVGALELELVGGGSTVRVAAALIPS
jgi:hypothetical protein